MSPEPEAGDDGVRGSSRDSARHHESLSIEALRDAARSKATPAESSRTESSRTIDVDQLAHDLRKKRNLLLIRGRRGTGRMQLARALHGDSRETFRSYACRDCSPLEGRRLFLGECRDGSADSTSHSIRRLGLLDEAHGGTLYLEDIDQLSLDVQRILARALRQGSFTPLGSRESRPCTGRFIASTSADIDTLVREGRFDDSLRDLIEECARGVYRNVPTSG